MVLTLVGLVFGILSAAAVALGAPIVGLIFWVVNRVIDGLDGAVARISGSQTDFGGYIDMMSDVTVYAALAIAMAVGQSNPVWIAAGVLLASFYINITSWTLLSTMLEKRVLSEDKPRATSMHMQAGLLEGTETIVFYAVLIAVPPMRFALMLVMAAAALVSTVQRLVFARRAL